MEKVTKRLFEMQDHEYRDFCAKLIPTVDKERIIGVRSPAMKAFIKEFAQENDKFLFIKELPHYYLEENGLHAALIPGLSKDINVIFHYIEEFLPYVDNWATCDTFTIKIFKKYPEELYMKILKWIRSSHPYTVRFGIINLLQYYLDEHFRPEINDTVGTIQREEYYINIAIAWYYSYALIKQYDLTIPLFESQTLHKWIHNKSIQKAVESFRITDDRKKYLKTLRRKS